MIEKKTWDEFRETGLLWYINTILEVSGWCIVIEYDIDGNITSVYPARTKYRGFSEDINDTGYKKVGRYLAENAKELYSEALETEETK